MNEHKRQDLIKAAIDVLRRNEHPVRHSVGAAVLCSSGRIYAGVNIGSSGFGVCAEPIALGAAIAAGERSFLAFVAVCDRGDGPIVLSPCGNCRQLIVDYAPNAAIIYMDAGRVAEAPASHLLPGAYTAPDMM